MSSAEVEREIGALTSDHETTVELTAVSVPALVLYGENGAGSIRRQCQLVSERLPDAELLEVPAAGHAANLDNPEFFTERIRAFLTDRAHWE